MTGSIKDSIKKKTAFVLSATITLAAVFLFALLYCIVGYRKNIQFFSDSYYYISNSSTSLYDYKVSMEQFCEQQDYSYLYEAQGKFDEAEKAFTDLYSRRFGYDGDVRTVIVDMQDEYDTIDKYMTVIEQSQIKEQAYGIYNNTISLYVTDIRDSLDNISYDVWQQGNSAYSKFASGITVVQVIAIISFIGLVASSIYSVYFIRNRIVAPVVNAYEWTRLFKDGYCEMADLPAVRNDEVGRLEEAFNIVKDKLSQANALKAQYDEAMERINTEEQYKKTFVQQLYAEKRDKEAISTAAKHDGLTGLYNRRTFDGIVEDFFNKKRDNARGALYLIDMDNFKNVNDTLGHLAGDDALKLLAGAMRIVFTGAYLGRYGGDEFIAFVPAFKNEDELENYAAELCKKMNTRFESNRKYVNLSVSVGIAITDNISEYSELYMKADKALYYSKENGRNQYKLESRME
ncbi:MAG: diguanylate cyclase [Lachnospiraceae bacterium]|nr:diguanylate cyclase [Lachnospiraceae bacterium]